MSQKLITTLAGATGVAIVASLLVSLQPPTSANRPTEEASPDLLTELEPLIAQEQQRYLSEAQRLLRDSSNPCYGMSLDCVFSYDLRVVQSRLQEAKTPLDKAFFKIQIAAIRRLKESPNV